MQLQLHKLRVREGTPFPESCLQKSYTHAKRIIFVKNCIASITQPMYSAILLWQTTFRLPREREVEVWHSTSKN
jgi:hypothetical protein